MAKMFYTAAEAAEKLGKTEDDLKALARQGQLREFRDAGTINYKVDDIDKLVAASGGAPAAEDNAGSAMLELEPAEDDDSVAGEIMLEPVEDSGVELAPSGTDILALDKVDFDDTATGAQTPSNEGSSVPSVGVSVFDDDEGDEEADPLASTAVTDLAGLALEGSGSGSGIMDLARESDDTSLGQELLDEIYTDDIEATADMGDDTRAGLDEAMPEATGDDEDLPAEVAAVVEPAAAAPAAGLVAPAAAVTDDPASSALTAVLGVGVIVLGFGGLAAAALVQPRSGQLAQPKHDDLRRRFTGAGGGGRWPGVLFGEAVEVVAPLAWWLGVMKRRELGA